MPLLKIFLTGQFTLYKVTTLHSIITYLVNKFNTMSKGAHRLKKGTVGRFFLVGPMTKDYLPM